MKPEQIYQELKDLVEKFGINVSEQNLRKTGISVKSGICKVKGKQIFIIDKHKSIHKKNVILTSFLKKMPHEDIYVVPAVRELISKRIRERYKKGRRHRGRRACPDLE